MKNFVPRMPWKNLLFWVSYAVGFLLWIKAITLGLEWISAPSDLVVTGGVVTMLVTSFIGIKVFFTLLKWAINWWYDNVLAP